MQVKARWGVKTEVETSLESQDQQKQGFVAKAKMRLYRWDLLLPLDKWQHLQYKPLLHENAMLATSFFNHEFERLISEQMFAVCDKLPNVLEM